MTSLKTSAWEATGSQSGRADSKSFTFKEAQHRKCFNTSTSTILIARPAQYNELNLSPTLYDSTGNHKRQTASF